MFAKIKNLALVIIVLGPGGSLHALRFSRNSEKW